MIVITRRTHQTGATLLKPFEKTMIRSNHKRLSVPLDKCILSYLIE